MQSVRRYLAIGFDMDGTLLRTDIDYPRLRQAVHDILADTGVPESELEGSGSVTFMGLDYLYRNKRFTDIQKAQERIRTATAYVEVENASTARLYDGGREMLEYLKNKGYKIGVLTRGSRRYAVAALTAASALQYIDVLSCRDDHDELEAKPSPKAMEYFAEDLGVMPKDILYLGDHAGDHQCARDSGAGFIGVLTRYSEDEWMGIDEKIRTIGTVADLIKIL